MTCDKCGKDTGLGHLLGFVDIKTEFQHRHASICKECLEEYRKLVIKWLNKNKAN